MTMKFKPVLVQIKPTHKAGDVPKGTLRLEPVIKSLLQFEHKTRAESKEKERP